MSLASLRLRVAGLLCGRRLGDWLAREEQSVRDRSSPAVLSLQPGAAEQLPQGRGTRRSTRLA